ncbi:MAG: T9SS type A sorting domain-containing protein, partial [Bacteroidetes bacterium]|nr:T9SS type A sorting domain-containing protein [Bacteroidota bacterium]
VTFTFTDPSGNKASTVATFMIQDLTAPLVVCPENIHLPECVETASWLATGSDACGSVTIVSDPPSGSVFEKGTAKVVNVTATDECGNKSTCNFTVTRDPDLAVAIDAPATSPLNTCALGTGANIVVGYGGAYCITLHAVGSGGHGPLTYSWTAPAEVPVANFVNGNTDSPTFCAGFQTIPCASYNFIVTVTDIHGCTETNQVAVNVINPLCTIDKNAKVNVCHRPSNNVSKGNTLCISANAIPAHLAEHTDCLGRCDATCISYAALAKGENTFTSLQDKDAPYSISAYPNPVNSKTTIHISAKYNTKAQLTVVDLTGRVLVVLFDGLMQENTPYLIDFDASKMQSGLYIVKLIGADGVAKHSTLVVAN